MLALRDPKQSLDIKKAVNLWFVRRNDDGFGCELCSENNIPELNNCVKEKKSSGYSNLKITDMAVGDNVSCWNQLTIMLTMNLHRIIILLCWYRLKLIYGWMNLTINKHLPFNIVENKTYRSPVKFCS